MKYKVFTLFFGILLAFAVSSFAEESSSDETEKEIPTEVSEPPYQVGQLPMEQGFYIERGEEQTRINLRFVENQIRVYWIDADGLIAEPEAESGNLRFTTSVRGRNYYGLTPISGDVGIGAAAIIPAPHIFNLILTLEGNGEPVSYDIRYTANLDKPVLPDGAEIPESKSSNY